ncbi:MAG: TcaA NTF2-like domain-containing protein [Anaerovoracaceae bacterium]|jgi:uncharacterized membrane protein YvbJ
MNRKIEILIGVLIILLYVFFIGGSIAGEFNNVEMAVERMVQAINEENYSYLKSRIKIEGMDKTPDGEEIKNLIKAIHDEGVNKYELWGSIDMYENSFYMIKKGRNMIFFDKYVLVFKLCDLHLTSNISDIDVYLDEQFKGRITKADNELIASDVMPGYHRVRIVHDGLFSNMEQEETICVFEKGSTDLSSHIEFEVFNIDIKTNVEGARLYVDDKDTGIKLSGRTHAGPFQYGDSKLIYAKIDIEGREYKSESIKVNGPGYYELIIDYREDGLVEEHENQEELRSLIHNYMIQLVNAINRGDYSLVEPYIARGSKLEGYQTKLVKDLYSQGTKEELLNYEILSLVRMDDDNLEAIVKESHKMMYVDGTDGQLNHQWRYTIVFENRVPKLANIRKE